MKKLLFLLLPLTAFTQVNNDRFDEILKSHPDFSGVLLVAQNGKPVYHKAVGYREFTKQIPLKKNDLFELASISKQFTAMIILMLKEKGLLYYDDPVEKYLSIPYKGITVRHLLTHTSGLPDYHAIMDQHWDKSQVAGNKEILEYLIRYAPPKNAEPGEKYEYSNTGYVLLASIAEKVSNKDFTSLCRQWIFRPLKMKRTDIRTQQQRASERHFAIGHHYIKEKAQYRRADSFLSSNYSIWLGNREGPGRVSSTAADLLRWDNALYTDKLVNPSTLHEAFSPMKLNNDSLSRYGFGWGLRQDPVMGKIVHHTGDNPGYKTHILRYTDKRKTIILLSNNAYENFGGIIKETEKWVGEAE